MIRPNVPGSFVAFFIGDKIVRRVYGIANRGKDIPPSSETYYSIVAYLSAAVIVSDKKTDYIELERRAKLLKTMREKYYEYNKEPLFNPLLNK